MASHVAQDLFSTSVIFALRAGLVFPLPSLLSNTWFASSFWVFGELVPQSLLTGRLGQVGLYNFFSTIPFWVPYRALVCWAIVEKPYSLIDEHSIHFKAIHGNNVAYFIIWRNILAGVVLWPWSSVISRSACIDCASQSLGLHLALLRQRLTH